MLSNKWCSILNAQQLIICIVFRLFSPEFNYYHCNNVNFWCFKSPKAYLGLAFFITLFIQYSQCDLPPLRQLHGWILHIYILHTYICIYSIYISSSKWKCLYESWTVKISFWRIVNGQTSTIQSSLKHLELFPPHIWPSVCSDERKRKGKKLHLVIL